jgi:hypothetical protein
MSSDRRRGSRLPEDPEYWVNLTARSTAAAFGTGSAPGRSGIPHAHRSAEDAWWGALSDAAFMLAASAALALLGGSLLLDERPSRAVTETNATAETRALTAVLAPDDPLLASLLDASVGPPSAAALLKLVALREVER